MYNVGNILKNGGLRLRPGGLKQVAENLSIVLKTNLKAKVPPRKWTTQRGQAQPSQYGHPKAGNPQYKSPQKGNPRKKLATPQNASYHNSNVNQEICQSTLINTRVSETKKTASSPITLPVHTPPRIYNHRPRDTISILTVSIRLLNLIKVEKLVPLIMLCVRHTYRKYDLLGREDPVGEALTTTCHDQKIDQKIENFGVEKITS